MIVSVSITRTGLLFSLVGFLSMVQTNTAFLTREVVAVAAADRPFNYPKPKQFTTTSSTQRHMVFDFFKKKSAEGVDQLNKLADASFKGELGKGLKDAAEYTKASNAAFASGLAKSRRKLLESMDTLFTGVSPEDFLEDLQDILLQADLGIAVAEDVVAEVQTLREDSTTLLKKDDLRSILRGKLIETFETGSSSAIQFSSTPDIPTVLFIMGANGMGKTTTIGKLAYRLRTEGNQTVMMAACDTFRAGAVEQLAQWAERAEVDIVGPSETATSPSAVLFNALDKAIKEKYDTVLVDTSGRLSNNDALTKELAKMKKVIQKRLSIEKDEEGNNTLNTNVPHETLLVLDAAQGRMALDSARIWNEEIGLTGLVLTKLDGSARGGSVVAVSRDLKLPVKLIGVGEGIEDLRDFQPEQFVDGLLGIGAAGGGKDSGVKDEGAMLAARLETMRKERDVRAEAAKKIGPPASAPAQAGAFSAPNGITDLTPDEMVTAGPSYVDTSQPNRSNTNKKKKKKKSRK